MSEYHKIQTVYKRDPDNKFKTLLEGDYSLPEFEYLANNEWVFTEKVDGTNIRVYIQCAGGVVNMDIRGRTDKAEIPNPLNYKLRSMFNKRWDKLFMAFARKGPLCLYGEGYGPKIQKGGGNYREDPGFVLFDVEIGGLFLERTNVISIAQSIGVDVVPIIGSGTLHDMVAMAKEGIISTWGNFQAEGIVARPSVEMRTRHGERIITKIKCKDFNR